MSNRPKMRWHPADRQAFANGVRNRASTIHGLRFDGPSADEWADDENEEA